MLKRTNNVLVHLLSFSESSPYNKATTLFNAKHVPQLEPIDESHTCNFADILAEQDGNANCATKENTNFESTAQPDQSIDHTLSNAVRQEAEDVSMDTIQEELEEDDCVDLSALAKKCPTPSKQSKKSLRSSLKCEIEARRTSNAATVATVSDTIEAVDEPHDFDAEKKRIATPILKEIQSRRKSAGSVKTKSAEKTRRTMKTPIRKAIQALRRSSGDVCVEKEETLNSVDNITQDESMVSVADLLVATQMQVTATALAVELEEQVLFVDSFFFCNLIIHKMLSLGNL